MTSTLTIGDFSRATHLGVKTLRHYHDIGLLEPVDVDADTGYRRYATEQIVTAQIIRRFRDLDMPLDDIHAVLDATDVETRNRVIANTWPVSSQTWLGPKRLSARSGISWTVPRPAQQSRTVLSLLLSPRSSPTSSTKARR
ncbi:MAG: hypothetical protein QOE72_4574 [Chloroflexota bacterium]|nr:hypothetical protein [Chloroflexota bacterium]